MKATIRVAVALIALLFALVSCQSTPYNPLECDPKFRDKDRRLFYAIKSRNLERIRSALQDNPDINVSDRIGQTALMWACNYGDLSTIKLLLDYNDTNVKGRGRARLNMVAQSRTPNFSYNALFALVMSPVGPNNHEMSALMSRMIKINPSVLKLGDFFGETIIHKIVRSGQPEFLDIVSTALEDSKPDDAFEKLLNQQSHLQQSPLELAVRLGDSGMLDKFVQLAEQGIMISGFNHKDLPLIAFAEGKGSTYIFAAVFRGLIAISSESRSRNLEFENARDVLDKTLALGADPVAYRDMEHFRTIYQKYLDKIPVNLLFPPELVSAVDDIFDLARGVPMNESQQDAFFEKLGSESLLLLAVNDKRPDPNSPNTFQRLPQLILEWQPVEVFERLFQISGSRWLKILNGYSDYLAASIALGNLRHTRFLLEKYPEPKKSAENLMNDFARFASDVEPLGEPLFVFYVNNDLSGNEELFSKVTRFYSRRFTDDTYPARLLKILEEKGRFEIIRMLFTDYTDILDLGTIFPSEKEQQSFWEVLFDNNLNDVAGTIIAHNITKNKELDEDVLLVIKERAPEMWQEYNEQMSTTEMRWYQLPAAGIRWIRSLFSKTDNQTGET